MEVEREQLDRDESGIRGRERKEGERRQSERRRRERVFFSWPRRHAPKRGTGLVPLRVHGGDDDEISY
jgi:hypothetical protein